MSGGSPRRTRYAGNWLALIAAAVLSAFAARSARAADPCRDGWWADFMLASHHIHPYRQFDEFNPGVGVECSVTTQWAASIGWFRNSLDRPSFYAGAVYTPEFAHFGWLHAGVMGGVISGYNYGRWGIGGDHRTGPLVLPTVVTQYRRVAMNFILVPPIHANNLPFTIGFQAKFRVY